VDPSLFEPPNNSLPLNKVPGGHQALLDGPFTLCGRSDLESDRFFTGSLSNLMMWDTGLEPVEVMRSVMGSVPLTHACMHQQHMYRQSLIGTY